jgi:hypothetical protein
MKKEKGKKKKSKLGWLGMRFPRKESRIQPQNLMRSFDVTNHLRTILLVAAVQTALGERAGVRASSL